LIPRFCSCLEGNFPLGKPPFFCVFYIPCSPNFLPFFPFMPLAKRVLFGRLAFCVLSSTSHFAQNASPRLTFSALEQDAFPPNYRTVDSYPLPRVIYALPLFRSAFVMLQSQCRPRFHCLFAIIFLLFASQADPLTFSPLFSLFGKSFSDFFNRPYKAFPIRHIPLLPALFFLPNLASPKPLGTSSS